MPSVSKSSKKIKTYSLLNQNRFSLTDECNAGANEIVSAARSQIGTPYVWGGGGWQGKSNGGFDCSGLAQYAVYKGTGKKIKRTASAQQNDRQCARVAFSARRAGDLVFYGASAHHVGIVASDTNKMIHAPKTGYKVKEAPMWTEDRQPWVRRCA